MEIYEYKHPYEWRFGRVVNRYKYPQDFMRKLDDPTPLAKLIVRTMDGEIRRRIRRSEMRLIEGS